MITMVLIISLTSWTSCDLGNSGSSQTLSEIDSVVFSVEGPDFQVVNEEVTPWVSFLHP